MFYVLNCYLYLEVGSSKFKSIYLSFLFAPSCLFHSRGLTFPRRAEAQSGLGWLVALWMTTNFSACPPGTAGLWIPPLVDQKILIQTWETSLAAWHSYLGRFISIPPDSAPYPPTFSPRFPPPPKLQVSRENLSPAVFSPQAPAEKAISLGVWLGREKNRNQDCLGPETIQVLLHPLQSQLTLNEHPSGKRPRFTRC